MKRILVGPFHSRLVIGYYYLQVPLYKNTIRDVGSTELWAAYTVDTVNTVHTVYTLQTALHCLKSSMYAYKHC